MSELNKHADSGAAENQLRAHSFDGIQEYDNPLPNWWLWLLHGSIVFSFAYWIIFHSLGIGKMPHESFEADMLAATEAQLARAAEGGLSNESLVLMSQIPARVDQGRALWEQYCIVCHSSKGEGLVGPNLTDEYWIHGNQPMDIHKVVTNGVPAKGMAAWGNQLGPTRVEAAVAYVLTLRGTNLAGKAPEGELYSVEP